MPVYVLETVFQESCMLSVFSPVSAGEMVEKQACAKEKSLWMGFDATNVICRESDVSPGDALVMTCVFGTSASQDELERAREVYIGSI
jgi:hypothetical protein